MSLYRLRVAASIAVLGSIGCTGKSDRASSRPDAAAMARQQAERDLRTTDNPVNLADGGSRFAPDAFFINDPSPPMCSPDGGRTEPPDAGDEAPNCPEDKHRQGCPCDTPGERVSCWPGKRVNRNHGRCRDGMTTCRASTEFEPSWGPCEGYVLPIDGATEGSDACRCFSNGEWALSNLVPCIYTDGGRVRVTSSLPDADKGFRCVADSDPTTDWTGSTLNAECAGQFQLCYTIKAGSVMAPKVGDCTLARLCIDTWYPEPGQMQRLPNLPGWAAKDQTCAQEFVDDGGYGEMSVFGTSVECDAVDDGNGKPHVFKRTRYCSTRCLMTPDAPECKACGTGGTGQF
jgi:hypothetical protein